MGLIGIKAIIKGLMLNNNTLLVLSLDYAQLCIYIYTYIYGVVEIGN